MAEGAALAGVLALAAEPRVSWRCSIFLRSAGAAHDVRLGGNGTDVCLPKVAWNLSRFMLWLTVHLVRQVFTAWGLLSGALFVSSAANTFIAIKHLGLSVASGIWCGTAILVSFFYGVGVAGDHVSHGVLAGLALLLLLLGVVGIAAAGQLGGPNATPTVDGLESGEGWLFFVHRVSLQAVE